LLPDGDEADGGISLKVLFDRNLNKARFMTLAGTSGGEILGFASEPGTTLGFSFLWAWRYNDPSGTTLKLGPRTIPVSVTHSDWYNDLTCIGDIDGSGEYMIMVYYRNMFSDNKNSIGVSRVSEIGSTPDWEPTFVPAVANASTADKQHPTWTAHDLL